MTIDKSLDQKIKDLTIDKLIGQKIKDLRLKNKLSQEELGRRCGVSFQQIQKYEKGTNKLSFSRLVDIAAIFNVSLDFFLNNDKEVSQPWVFNETQADFNNTENINSGEIEQNLLNIFRKLNSIKDKTLKLKIISIIDILIH